MNRPITAPEEEKPPPSLPTTTESTNPTSSQNNSPLNFGVTTLQKIFRSLTPSGVWPDGSEEKPAWTDSDVKLNDNKTLKETTAFPVLDSSPTIMLEKKTSGRDTSQLFHPETEAMTLVNGLGDASFGTPV